MTDRGRDALRQSPRKFEVGPSSLTWERGELVIDINEISAPPVIGRVRGKIRVTPSAITGVELPLTPDGAHVWRPFAPVSTVTCDLEAPGWQWTGHGYFDANFGTRALEADFAYWTWGRYPTASGATCFYDATRLDGSELGAGFHFDRDGSARAIDLPQKRALPRSLWQVRRETRGDGPARQVMPMLDAPFYTRAMVETQLEGQPSIGVHEALDLRRFRSPLLKPMLAVRVPRRARWNFGI
nr:carotenoid 1,2-hydratase [Thetidibacter halocola]